MRRLKTQVLNLLQGDELDAAVDAIVAMPPRQVINPLLGLLYHSDAHVSWHAVSAIGQVVARLADRDLEAARVIMRRLMWNLNDESGGIGWGAPQAMGEIMACQGTLAAEYAAILISYLNPAGNYLEHEGLQQGAVWGFGRMARAHDRLASAGAAFLRPSLSSAAHALRGLAVWAAAPVLDAPLKDLIRPLCWDPAVITLYSEKRLKQVSVGDLARAALSGP